MAATVDALLPLSLLEGVRTIDRPIDDPDTEFVDELRNKRFGLSDTVQAQIRRYADAVRRSQRSAAEDVVALARLISRRPDAEAVFRAAGQFLAARAYATVGATTRRTVHVLPGFLARPLALRQVRRLAQRYLGGTLARVDGALVLDVPRPLTVDTPGERAGCAFYEAGFAALLALLTAHDGAVEHVECAARADGRCRWRAAWGR